MCYGIILLGGRIPWLVFFTPILYQFFIVQGACLTGTPLKVSVYIVNQTNKCQNLVTIWNYLGHQFKNTLYSCRFYSKRNFKWVLHQTFGGAMVHHSVKTQQ